jgi:hypothetical protein
MTEKKVYRFGNHCHIVQTLAPERCGITKKGQRRRSALATVLARRSGRSSALPYPPLEQYNSTMLAWLVFRC